MAYCEPYTVNPTMSQQLAGLTDRAAVVSQERLNEYAVDGLTPRAVTRPRDRQEVAEVLKWASRQQISVFARGRASTSRGLIVTNARIKSKNDA